MGESIPTTIEEAIQWIKGKKTNEDFPIVKKFRVITKQIKTDEPIMVKIKKQLIRVDKEEAMSNKATDKAKTGKPDRGNNSPFKKKTPQSQA